MTTPNLLKDAINDYMDLMDKLRTENSQMTELLRELLTFLPDRNDALNYAATNDGRVGQVHVAVSKAQALLSRIGGQL